MKPHNKTTIYNFSNIVYNVNLSYNNLLKYLCINSKQLQCSVHDHTTFPIND